MSQEGDEMTGTAVLATETSEDPRALGVIDCDTHIGLPFDRPSDWIPSLMPHLSSYWKQRLDDGSITFVTGAWSHAWHFIDPGGGNQNRLNADVPGGERLVLEPQFVVEDHLEPENIVANMIITHGGPPYLVQTPDACAVFCSAWNDFHVERWFGYDSRFRIAASLPHRFPQAAVEEIERVSEIPGVAGVFLQPTAIPFGAPHYEPILAAANDAEIAIFSHGGSDHMYGDGQMPGAYPDSAFGRYMGWNSVGSALVANLVISGTFERYEKLRFIFNEYGFAWLAPLMRRLDHIWRSTPEKLPALRRLPSEYILDHVRVVSQPALETPQRTYENIVLDEIHAERTMVFSSDYPHWDGDETTQIFKGASPELMRRIFHDNAVETIGPRLFATG
jgi:predicted TIM-barrel fold metal-dependent hydrolase